MKYRIRIVTFVNGRITYTAQVKARFGWMDLDYRGNAEFLLGTHYEQESREDSLNRIDLNYAGNSRKQTIVFEYINKP